MIGLCVCLDSLDSSTASTLFFCLSFGIFFLVFSPPFSDSTFDSGEKKNNQKSLAAFVSLSPAGPVQQPKANFRFKNFHFPAHFFFSPSLFVAFQQHVSIYSQYLSEVAFNANHVCTPSFRVDGSFSSSTTTATTATTDRGGREKYSLYVHVIDGLKNELLISLCRKEVQG